MKEITSTTANFLARIPLDQGERLVPEIEIGLVVSEVGYRLGNTGQLKKERVAETVRFVVSAENLRKLAKTLGSYADEAETALSEALRDPVNKESP